jgi:hypothetical protein
MNQLNRVLSSHIEDNLLVFLPDISGMRKSLLIWLVIIAMCQCTPVQEKILGRYDIDLDRGCPVCEENGPASMVFEDSDVADGIPGYYSFEFADGEAHSGTYDFLQVDTTLAIILYPDSATVQYSQLIGTAQNTQYRVAGNKIKEDCNGLFRNCTWIRRD